MAAPKNPLPKNPPGPQKNPMKSICGPRAIGRVGR
jgi:hypothetical protein